MLHSHSAHLTRRYQCLQARGDHHELHGCSSAACLSSTADTRPNTDDDQLLTADRRLLHVRSLRAKYRRAGRVSGGFAKRRINISARDNKTARSLGNEIEITGNTALAVSALSLQIVNYVLFKRSALRRFAAAVCKLRRCCLAIAVTSSFSKCPESRGLITKKS